MAEESDRQVEVCESCVELKPVALIDHVGRNYCADCVKLAEETVRESPVLQFMLTTVPFRVGDRVECRTAEVLYDGIGTIDEVSMSVEKFGTPFHPSFHVVIEEKAYPEAPDDVWYMERQLKKVDA